MKPKMKSPKHNSALCNNQGMRCVHCCTIDYSMPKKFYENLFKRRREIFDRTIQDFPKDLRTYLLVANAQNSVGLSQPCAYLGMVDKNPGCMLHPSMHNGVDVRADSSLIEWGCSPDKGCFFHNYLRTPAEKKLAEDFITDSSDWYSYSNNLMECAKFNRNWHYLISRIPLKLVSELNVAGLVDDINSELRTKFPRAPRDIFARTLDNLFWEPGPTEQYMKNSSLFREWGFDGGFEDRFDTKQFREWGYFLDGDKPLYVYKPLGEILPLHFDDAAITSSRKLKIALKIVDGAIERFGGSD